MPCSKYKGKQRALCYATKEWTDWSKIRKKGGKMTKQKQVKGHLRKIPGSSKKVRVRGHLRKVRTNYK